MNPLPVIHAVGLFLLTIVVPSALLALLGLGLMRRAKRRSAAWRAGVAQAALLGILFLPFAIVFLPKTVWPILPPEAKVLFPDALYHNPPPGEPPPMEGSLSAKAPATGDTASVPQAAVLDGKPGPDTKTLNDDPFRQLRQLLLIASPVLVWIVGVLVGLGRFAFGLLGLARLRWTARRAEGEALWEALENARRALGYRRPVLLLVSSRVGVPVTWGWLRPKIVFPAEAVDWAPERLGAACLHELGHVQRHDFVVQTAGRLACVLHWYNPLVWRLFAAWKRDAEVACDDGVLRSGYAREQYGEILLALARVTGAAGKPESGCLGLGLAMARAATLEVRMGAILDPEADRQPVAAWKRWAVALGVLAAVAAYGAIRLAHAPRPGEVYSPEIVAALQGIARQAEAQAGYKGTLRMEVFYDQNGWSAREGKYLPAPAPEEADATIDLSSKTPRYRIAYRSRFLRSQGEAPRAIAGGALELGDGAESWSFVPGADSHSARAEDMGYLAGYRYRADTSVLSTAKTLLRAGRDLHQAAFETTIEKTMLNDRPVFRVYSLMDVADIVWRHTWWLDPARDYAVVQQENATFQKGGGGLLSTTLELTQVGALRQVAPGVWYPTGFTTDSRKYVEGKPTDDSFYASARIENLKLVPAAAPAFFRPSEADKAGMAAPKAVAVAAVSAPAASGIPGEVSAEAVAIYREMRARYAAATTFSCIGTRKESMSWPMRMSDNRAFQIRFARPGLIRIEYEEPTVWNGGTATSVIYTENGKIGSRWGLLNRTSSFPSIEDAISTEAGVSGTISYVVPNLLLGKNGYFDYWGLERQADAVLDGQDCFVLRMETKGFGFYALFIRKADHALLRARQEGDAAVLDAQRERAHKENPHWFNDGGSPRKTGVSATSTMDFSDIVFDAPIAPERFTLSGGTALKTGP